MQQCYSSIWLFWDERKSDKDRFLSKMFKVVYTLHVVRWTKSDKIGFCQIHKINVLRLHVVKEIQQKGNKLAFVGVSRSLFKEVLKISSSNKFYFEK